MTMVYEIPTVRTFEREDKGYILISPPSRTLTEKETVEKGWVSARSPFMHTSTCSCPFYRYLEQLRGCSAPTLHHWRWGFGNGRALHILGEQKGHGPHDTLLPPINVCTTSLQVYDDCKKGKYVSQRRKYLKMKAMVLNGEWREEWGGINTRL